MFHRGNGTLHMGSIRRKVHHLPENTHSKGQYSSQWGDGRKLQEGSKCASRHPISLVRVDVTVIEICNPTIGNEQATTLRTRKQNVAGERDIHRGDG